MKAADFSEILLHVYQTALHCVPEHTRDLYLQHCISYPYICHDPVIMQILYYQFYTQQNSLTG
jgi:hypothetical protein